MTQDRRSFDIEIEQITFGPNHHFFGYIGHARTIPWNASGRYIVALRSVFQDHMPGPREAADVILMDTESGYAVRKVDRSLAWNIQQGTMYYWNPARPETQFFFNDRDPDTNKVFTVLFDISEGKRVREYRYDDSPTANSGVAQNGGYFLGLNYARMARLRLVTGYPGAYDWTEGVLHPEDDGVFKVHVETGERRLVVSFAQMRDALRARYPQVEDAALFINHTLWNRGDDLIYFYARGNFGDRDTRIDAPLTVRPDGNGLTEHRHIGGHPEWDSGHRLVGSDGEHMIVYDTDRKGIVETLGDRTVFPRLGGDTAVSPDGRWLVSGYGEKPYNVYVLYRRCDGAWARSPRYDQTPYVSGDLRSDPAPCWNRDSTQVLFPSISEDGTRQLYIIHLLGIG